MSKLFANYAQYLREIRQASKLMHPDKKARSRKMLTCSAGSIAAAACAFTIAGTGIANAQVAKALQAVSADLENAQVRVNVDGLDESLASMLSDKSSTLSAADEANIAQQIKSSISQDSLSKAKGVILDDSTFEATITTDDGTPVKVIIKRNADGTFTIQSVVAELTPDEADEKRVQASSAVTTQAQKDAHLVPFEQWVQDVMLKNAGVAEDASDEDKAGAAERVSVIAKDLMLVIPSGYQEQDPAASEPGENVCMAKKDEDKTDAERATDFTKPYVRSYKSSDGSTLSVRAENLGSAFASMNGYDAVSKMMGYWTETSQSVASGANQKVANEDVGYITEVFYDDATELWGYWGRVHLTDGTRDVIYDRCVLIDEVADQMYTISYRHDCGVDEGGDLSLDAFKALFMTVPDAWGIKYPGTSGAKGDPMFVGAPDDEGASVIASVVGGDDALKASVANGGKEIGAVAGAARDKYLSELEKLLIAPGQTKTLPDIIAEREAAEKARAEADAAEQAGDGAGAGASGESDKAAE